MKMVSIIIAHHNGYEILKNCITSLSKVKYENKEVIVVDNASNDGSVEEVKKEFPWIRVLRLEENKGFAGGNNEGVKIAKGEYILILNNDTEVEPDFLDWLVKTMEENKSIGVVQPKIKDLKAKEYFEYAGGSGGFLDSLGYPFCRGRIFFTVEKDEGQYDDVQEITWASGACMLIKKSVIEELGLFDEKYFAHQEEIDFCWRVWRAGYRIVVQPKAIIYHLGGGTLPMYHPKKYFLNLRNNLFTLYKNLPATQIFWKLALRFFFDLASSFLSIKLLPQVLKAWLEFFHSIPQLSKERKKFSFLKHKIPYYKGFIPLDYFIFRKKQFSTLPPKKFFFP